MAKGPDFPPTIVAGLLALHHLDESAFSDLRESLSSAGITLNFEEIVSKLAGIPHVENPSDLSRTLIGLSSGVDKYGLETILSNVADSMEISEPFKSFDSQTKEALISKLRTLLTGQSTIKQFLKAIRVVQSHQQVFSECRILTDIRPVFNEIGNEPVAAAILHNLKISFNQDEEARDFYVVLDDRDLRTLQEQLNRAIIKSNSLHKLLNKSGIPCLTPEESDQNETTK